MLCMKKKRKVKREKKKITREEKEKKGKEKRNEMWDRRKGRKRKGNHASGTERGREREEGSMVCIEHVSKTLQSVSDGSP